MIRDCNIADDANIQPHKILGGMSATVMQYLTGELFWVGNDGDAAFEKMATRIPADHIFTSLDTAVGACTANRGDVIVCMEGFTETVTAAGGLALDVAGITIVFLGTGTSQAYITFTTDVDADMDVDAADITLIRPKFVAGIDALTGPIDVNSTDFTMIDAEYHDGTSINTTDAVVATSGATRLKILGYRFVDGDAGGTQKESHIQLNGCDDIILEDIDIRGDFDVGCVENVTDEVLNARFENWNLYNTKAGGDPALYLDANSTGSCKNVKLRVATGTTYANSYGKMSWDNQCEGFSGVSAPAGDPLGTVAATGLEGKIDTIASDLIVADAIIDTIASDIVVLDPIIDTIASDIVVLDPIIDTIASDLVVMDAILDTVASDLVVADAIIDTIASDIVVLDPIIDTIASDLVVMDAILDTVASDIVVLDPIIDTIASDLVVMDAILDTVASDLVVADAIIDTIASDIVVLDPIIDTIASDLVVMDAILDTVASDIVVLDPIIDTIASDLVIVQSDVKSFWTAWQTFETLVSDFIVKYESDNP